MAVYNFGTMIEKLKKNPKRIVFTEGTDVRILEAASRLLASNFLTPVLIGNVTEVERKAEEEGYNIRGAVIIDPENYDKFDAMVAMFCELRKSKGVTPAQAKGILSAGNYFGTMLVKMGEADCLLGGATYSTADTVRPLPVTTRSSRWLTARSTSSPPKTSWSRSAARPWNAQRSSASTRR